MMHTNINIEYILACAKMLQIRRPGSACTVILILCRIQNMSAKTPPKIKNQKSKIRNPKSEIQNPKFAQEELLLHKAPKSKIRNPKSKIPAKIQNLGRWGPHIKNCYITIQNPKSKIPKNPAKKVWILDFGFGNFRFWGGPGDVPLGNSVTVPWGQRRRIPPGPSLAAGAKSTVSDTVGEREQTWL